MKKVGGGVGGDDLFSNYFSKYNPTPYTPYIVIATSQEYRASREVM